MKIKKFNFALVFITLLMVLFLFLGLNLGYLLFGIEGVIKTMISLFIITIFIWSCLKNE